MVSAQEMEARLETLERGFSGLLTMRDNVDKILEDRREKLEAGETHGDGDQTDSDDASVHHDCEN
ncbi:hypothetical protein L195_g014527 [Trifolium pratense]|uniref:Uncharacterized protein n=1 Tax=Trifolium pratense TaxID=57577 RepID=A0A2K3PR65_TRIPR|nr:hypothetical protein L195_g014527 [Trifolium pratense]